jgi:ferritin-like metal-binding protein YciE
MMNDKMNDKYAEWRWFLDQNYGPHVNTEIAKVLDETEAEIKRLEAQRNELLAVARATLDAMCKVTAFGNDAVAMTDALDALDAAIAKAEASQ